MVRINKVKKKRELKISKIGANPIPKKYDYIDHPWLSIGLIWVCDVCGKPLLKSQKFGKKAENDALCHQKCLYIKVGNKKIPYEKYIIQQQKKAKKDATIERNRKSS